MNLIKLIFRNVHYYKKEHLLLLLGVVLSTAVLTAALIIGNSVQFSLKEIVNRRLGTTQQVVVTQERFMPASFAQVLSDSMQTTVAPVLLLRGIAGSDHVEGRVPDVQIYGVESRFWEIGNAFDVALKENEVAVNQKLAERLQLQHGDELFVRLEKASFVTDNAPFVPDENNSVAVRMKVKVVLNENHFGNFNVRTDQITPYNVFFPLERLSKLNFEKIVANLMLIAPNRYNVDEVYQQIRNSWSLDVINLKIEAIPGQQKIELNSDRVFVEDTICQLLRTAKMDPEPVFTYLVNFIRANEKATPYSFVSALSRYPEHALSGNEMMINSWLADDLGVGVGDTLLLDYYVLGMFRKLEERSAPFVVKAVVEHSGFAADSLLMPAFEGLAGVESCSDWKAGVPVDFSKIRDKDEDWWKKYKGTPKAFIAYEKAVEIWGQDFGNATSIRFSPDVDSAKIARTLLRDLHPLHVGINVVDVKSESAWSASNAVDFAGLFLALSFFLLVAAFLLTALLFSMLMVQRSKEQGVYQSIGWARKSIYQLFFAEGMLNAVVGSVAGIVGGVLLARLVLVFLNSIWFDIVRTSQLYLHVTTTALLVGWLSNVVVSAVVIGFMLRNHFKKHISMLTKRIVTVDKANRKPPKGSLIITLLSMLVFVALLVVGFMSADSAKSGLFLVSGFVLLLALISLLALLMRKKWDNAPGVEVMQLAMRNLSFDYQRNLTIVSILSIGIFIVLSTGANRSDLSKNATDNSSGTGGFTYFIQTSLGVNADLSTLEGRSKMAVEDSFDQLEFVQFSRFESDDASCLNLNRIIRPSVLGVNPDQLSVRKSFSFAKTIKPTDANPWVLLKSDPGSTSIPAIADQTVITWSLGKSVGDSLLYFSEKGDSVYLVLVAGLNNSVFQGNLIISDENFRHLFPSNSGSKVMLASVNPSQQDELKENLEGAFRNFGVNIEVAAERLATFNSVTNTYLDIFIAIGGIALLLGTIGIAIVLIRSIHARKNHYAMMQAFGISALAIRKTIFYEFLLVLFAGIFIGVLAAFIATFSVFMQFNPDVPYRLLASIVVLFSLNGLLWIYLGSTMSVKKKFLEDLRNE